MDDEFTLPGDAELARAIHLYRSIQAAWAKRRNTSETTDDLCSLSGDAFENVLAIQPKTSAGWLEKLTCILSDELVDSWLDQAEERLTEYRASIGEVRRADARFFDTPKIVFPDAAEWTTTC
jgi:hypothetical protein